jgi:hypothetical protein
MNNFYVWMENFSKDEIESTAKTFDKYGFNSSMPSDKLLTYVLQYLSLKPDAKILDYGSGKFPAISKYLSSFGYDVISHELETNMSKHHDKNALENKYDLVFAAGVINVQKNEKMLLKTLREIKSLMKSGGSFVASIPDQPKTLRMKEKELIQTIKSVYPNAKFDKYYDKGLLLFVNF